MISLFSRLFNYSNSVYLGTIVTRLLKTIDGRTGVDRDKIKEIRENFKRNVLDLSNLGLTDVDIVSIFDGFNEAALTKLGENIVAVDLACNKLSAVPDFLNHLNSLSFLNISSNQLKVIKIDFLQNLISNYKSNTHLVNEGSLCLDLGFNPCLTNSDEIIDLFRQQKVPNSLFISELRFQHLNQHRQQDELGQISVLDERETSHRTRILEDVPDFSRIIGRMQD